MKRTYQPNKRKRAKTHGFRSRPSPRQGPQASHGERQITHATRMRTLKSRLEFERAFTQGRRYNHPLIRMVICDAVNEGDPGRVAFVAAKRLGCAVVRNRSKRVLRPRREASRRWIRHYLVRYPSHSRLFAATND